MNLSKIILMTTTPVSFRSSDVPLLLCSQRHRRRRGAHTAFLDRVEEKLCRLQQGEAGRDVSVRSARVGTLDLVSSRGQTWFCSLVVLDEKGLMGAGRSHNSIGLGGSGGHWHPIKLNRSKSFFESRAKNADSLAGLSSCCLALGRGCYRWDPCIIQDDPGLHGVSASTQTMQHHLRVCATVLIIWVRGSNENMLVTTPTFAGLACASWKNTLVSAESSATIAGCSVFLLVKSLEWGYSWGVTPAQRRAMLGSI